MAPSAGNDPTVTVGSRPTLDTDLRATRRIVVSRPGELTADSKSIIASESGHQPRRLQAAWEANGDDAHGTERRVHAFSAHHLAVGGFCSNIAATTRSCAVTDTDTQPGC